LVCVLVILPLINEYPFSCNLANAALDLLPQLPSIPSLFSPVVPKLYPSLFKRD
jgi:hypothetical protein